MNKRQERLLSGRIGRCFEIRILMRQTARAFGADVPEIAGFSASKLLKKYAAFTAQEAARAQKSGQDMQRLHQRLFAMAYRLGDGLRRWMRPQNAQECLAILILVYRNIGIEIRKAKGGKICVEKCYFSSFYTPEICSVISAIDQGIFAGVCHGGKLIFQERITEGHEVCMADFKK